MALLFAPPRFKATDKQNNPIPGAFLSFYATLTSTFQPIYADSALSSSLTNPAKADANGLLPEIWLDDSLAPYKVIFSSPNISDPTQPGSVIWTIPQYNATLSGATLFPLINPITDEESAAGFTPVDYEYAENNVKRFGAKGDGQADDTMAIQAALTYAGINNFTSLYFPQGRYKVSSTLTIPGTRITLMGEGVWASQIISAITGSAPIFQWLSNAGGTTGAYLHVEKLRIIGNGLTGANGTAHAFSLQGIINTAYGNYATFRDVEIQSCMGSGLNNAGNAFAACAVYGFNLNVAKFENCQFNALQQGIVIDGSTTSPSAKVSVTGCTFDTITSYGIQALYVDQLLVDEQTIFNDVGTGSGFENAIYINQANSVTINGCRFKETNGGSAIFAGQSVNIDQLNITNNLFYTSFAYPHLTVGTNCQGVVIQGNELFFDFNTLLGIGISITNPSGFIGGSMVIIGNRWHMGGNATLAACIQAVNATNPIESLLILGNYFGQAGAVGTQVITDAIALTGAGGATNAVIMGNTFSLASPGAITNAVHLGSACSGTLILNNSYPGVITNSLVDSGTKTTRIEGGSTSIPSVGFFGAIPVNTRPVVSGSRGSNAALASLLTQLALLGVVTDSSS